MLSSFLNGSRVSSRWVPGTGLVLCAWVAAAPVSAAEYYYRPRMSLTAEADSNPAYDPTFNAKFIQGYTGQLETILGVLTPTSDTAIRPRISYQNFPGDAADFNRFEEFLDLRHTYHSPRTKFSLLGSFYHRSDLSGGFPEAQFNQFGPNNTPVPSTGVFAPGGTRTQILLVPDYSYQLTERLKAGINGLYQKMNYSPESLAGRTSFHFYQEKAYLGWSLSPRQEVDVGGFATQYSAKTFVSRTNAYGVSIDHISHPTQLITNTVSVTYQKNDIHQEQPIAFIGSKNTWTAFDTLVYQGLAWRVTFIGGRLLTPSGGGGIYATDQVRLQYDKDFTARLNWLAAIRYLRDKALEIAPGESSLGAVNRNYVRAETALKYHLTPTWFVVGEYQYGHQRYEIQPNGASNHQLSITINYQALPPRYY